MNDPAGLFRALCETAEDAIFVVEGASGTILAANAQAKTQTGYTSQDLHRLPIPQLLKPRLQAPEPEAYQTSWLANVAGSPLDLTTINGEGIPVHVSLARFHWADTSCVLVIASKLTDRNARESEPQRRVPEREEFPTIVGQSVKIREVCRRIGSLSKSDVTVLIQGESGTGKEVIANAVHAHSLRGRGPFVKVNCAALTETLLESELFGHVKGAFTGAIRDRLGRFKQADGGTIFLDEIGSMSPAGQAKLLRVLQEREFEPVGSSSTTKIDVRVIAATNSDLAKAVSEGKFREDLYYRLNVFPICVPPLRERKEDIALLANHFLQQHTTNVGKTIRGLSPEAIDALVRHSWPGNVRELENAVEHAVIVEQGAAIAPDSLPMSLAPSRSVPGYAAAEAEPGLRDRLNIAERQMLVEALARANGVKKRAAAMLGVDARNLPYLLRKHHLDSASQPDGSVH